MEEETMRGAIPGSEEDDHFDLPPVPVGGTPDDDDDAMTPDEFDQLVTGITHPAGDYLFQLTQVTDKAPTPEKMGGTSVTMNVVKALAGQVPKTGVFGSITVTFKKFHEPTEKQVTSERMDKQAMAELVKALGLAQPDADGKIRLKKALLARGQGRQVIGAVAHEKGSDGRTYQRLKLFRPIAG